MVITFTVPQTGHQHQVSLKPELVQMYRQTVQDMTRFNSPALDRARRTAHNKLSIPVLHIIRQELPDLDEKEASEEARHIVTAFLEVRFPAGQSMVGNLRNSGSLL